MSDIGKVILLKKNGQDGQFLPVPRNSEQDIVIGKSATADIRIKNVDVADLHCSISYNGYKATIRPLSKSAITFVNNSAIKGQQTVVLKHNDLIQVEDRIFRWEYVQDTNEPSSKSPIKGQQRKSEPPIKLMGAAGVNRSMILPSPVFKRRSLMLKKPPVALTSTSKTNKANASLRKINKTPGLNRSHLNSAAKLKNPNILRVLKQGCGFLASPSSSQDIGGGVNVVSGVLSSPLKSPQSARNVVLNGKSATSPRKAAAKSGSPQGTKSARPATSNKKRGPMSPKMSRAKRKLDLNESNGYEDDDSMIEDGTDGTGSGNPAVFFSLSEEEDVDDGTADMIEPSPSSLYEDSVCSLPDTTASLFHSTALGAGGSTPKNPKTPLSKTPSNNRSSSNLSQTAPISSTRNSSNRLPCYHPSRNLSKTTTPTASSVSRSNVAASGSRSRTLNNLTVNRTTNASRGSTNKNVSFSVSHHNTTVTNSPRQNSTSSRVYSNNNSRSRRSSRSPEFESTLNFWENLEEESTTSSVTAEGKSPSKSRNNSTRAGLSVLNGTSSRASKKSLLSPLYVSPGTNNNTGSSSFYTPQQSHSLPPATDKQHSAIFTPYTCDLSPNSRIGTPLAGSDITSPIQAYDSVTAEEIQAALSAAAQAAQQDTPPTTPAHTPSPRGSSRKNTPSGAASSSKKTPTPPATTRTPRGGASQKSTPSSSPATKSPRNSRKSASASTPQSATKNISSASSSSFGGSSKKSTPAAKKGSSTPSSPAKSSPKTPAAKSSTKNSPRTKSSPKTPAAKSSTKKSPATKSSPKTPAVTPKRASLVVTPGKKKPTTSPKSSTQKSPAAKKAGATPKRASLVVTPGKKKLTASPKSSTKKSPATSSSRKSTTPKSAPKKTPSSKTPSSKRTTPSSKASTPRSPAGQKSNPSSKASTPRSPVVPKKTPAKSSTPSGSPTPRKKVSLQIALKKPTPGRKTPAKRNTVSVTPQKKTPAKKSIPASSAQKKTPRGAALKEVSISEQDGDEEDEVQPLFSGSRGLASPLVVYNLVTPDELEVAETISLPLCSAVKTPTPPRSRNSPRQSSAAGSGSKASSSTFNASRSSSSPLVVYNLVTEDEIAKVESISLPLCSVHDSPAGPSSSSSSAAGKKSSSYTKTCFNTGRKSSSPLVVYNLVTEDELVGDAVPLVGFTPGKTSRRSPGGFPPAHPPSTVLNVSRSSSSPMVVYNLVTPGQLSHVAEPLEEAALLDSTPVTDSTRSPSAQTSARSRKASSSVKKSAITPASTRKTATKETALPQASAVAGPSTAAGQVKKSLRFLALPSPTVKGTPGKTRGSTRGSIKPVEDSVVVLNSTKTSSRKRKLAETIDLDDVDPSSMFSPDFSLRPSSVSKSGVLSPRLSTPYPLKKRLASSSSSSSTAGQRVSFDPNLRSSLPPPAAVATKHRKSSLKTVYERSSLGKGHHNSFSSNDSSLNYSDVSDLGRQRQGFTSTPMPARGGGVNTGATAGAAKHHLQSILKTTSSREDLNGSVGGGAGNGSFSGSEKSLRFNSHVDFSSTFDSFDSPQITRDVFVSPLTASAMENNSGETSSFNISRNKSTRQENRSRSAVAARSLLGQNSMNVSRTSRSAGKLNASLQVSSANISRNRSTRLDKSLQLPPNASRSNKSSVRGQSVAKSRLSMTSSSGSQSSSPKMQRRSRSSSSGSQSVSPQSQRRARGSISPAVSTVKKNSSVKANSSAKKNTSNKKSLNRSSRESSAASSSAESSRSKTTASSSKSSGLNGSIHDMETMNSTGIQGIEALTPSPSPAPRQAPPAKSPRPSVHLNKYKHFLTNKTPNQGYASNLTGLDNLFADDEQEMLSPIDSPASARASGKKSTTKRPPSSVTVTTTVKIELASSTRNEQTSTRKTRKTHQVETSPSPVKSPPVQVRGRAASTRKTIVVSSPVKSPIKKGGRVASKKTQQVEIAATASSSPASVTKSPAVKSRAAASRLKRQVEEKRPSSVPSPKSPVAKRTTRGRKTAVVSSPAAAAAASVPKSSSRAAKATAQLLLDTSLVTDKKARKTKHTPASPIPVVPAKKSRKQTAAVLPEPAASSSQLPPSPSPKKSSRRTTTALAKQSPKKVVTPKASRSRSAKANAAEAAVASSSTSKPAASIQAASKRKTRAEKPLPSPPASKKPKRGETAASPAPKVSSPAPKKSKRGETAASPAPKLSSPAPKKSKRGERAAAPAPSKKVSSPAAVTPVKTRRGRPAATTMVSSPVPSASKTTKKVTKKSSQPAASVAVSSPVEKGKRGRGRASAKTDAVASPQPGPSSKPTPKKQTRSKRGTVVVTPVKSAVKSPKPTSVKKAAAKKSPKPTSVKKSPKATRSRKTTKSTSPAVATKATKSTKKSAPKTTTTSRTPTPNKVQKKVAATPKKTTTAKAAKAAAAAKNTAKPQVQSGKEDATVKASTSAAAKKTKVQTKAATTPKTSPSPKVAKRTRAASSKQATTAASKKPAAKRPSLLVKKKIQSPKTQRPKRGAKK